MAADETATRICTATLTADTNLSMSLTAGGAGSVNVEVTHHGDDTTVVYFMGYATEPDDELTGGGADNERPLLAGERIVVKVPRVSGEPVWLEFISAGTPTVSAEVLG